VQRGGRPDPGDPAGRCRLDPPGRQTLAWRHCHHGDDSYCNHRTARREVVDWMEKVSDEQYGK
jgi:hypothetical protein